ncbi:MAG: serine/threonine-protein kinase [Myxococcales bacterium]
MRSGQRVGRYILGEQLGRGGMAEVWSARAEGPGGFVKSLALKFIADSFTGDADLERLFVNEARVAAQLQHANLVSVFDFDKWADPESGEPGRYYIAMERVEGQDLRRVLQVARHQGQRLSPALALHIAGEVLKGLRYVHEHQASGVASGAGPVGVPGAGASPSGLVHRDVSPHNVLIGRGGEVKLSDFGIAKVMSQSLGTQVGMVRGKLAYGSPEQLRGEPVDHRSDQFALGVILWEMLAGRRLFEGANEVEIVGKVLRCEIPALPATIDPQVDRVTRRMLASAPADRFPSTGDALAAVMATPGYAAHAPALVELMYGLFAPRPLVLPPTVPLVIAPGPPRGGLAETSELESTPLDSPAPAPAGTAPAEPADVPEIAAATGSGYVSADTPHIPSWLDQSGGEAPRRRRMMPAVVIAATVLLATAVMATRRWTSFAPRGAPTGSHGPRPPAQQPVRIVDSARSRPNIAPPAAPAPPSGPPTRPSVHASEPGAGALPSIPAPRMEPPAVPPTPQPELETKVFGHHPSEARYSGRRLRGGQPQEDVEPPAPVVEPMPLGSSAQKRKAANGAPILE